MLSKLIDHLEQMVHATNMLKFGIRLQFKHELRNYQNYLCLVHKLWLEYKYIHKLSHKR